MVILNRKNHFQTWFVKICEIKIQIRMRFGIARPLNTHLKVKNPHTTQLRRTKSDADIYIVNRK